MVRINHYSTYF